jgi:hypothetical protein
MSETTVTVIGMVVAFITASITTFFAEPIKDFFQTKAKIRVLRIALYKELVHNYFSLSNIDRNPSNITTAEFVARSSLRNECYNHALQNELSVFYQLDEASVINSLYNQINTIVHFSGELHKLFSDEVRNKASDPAFVAFMNFVDNFRDGFVSEVYIKTFDVDLLKRLVKADLLQEIMKKGKEVYDRVANVYPK